jgi:hypothetical protein
MQISRHRRVERVEARDRDQRNERGVVSSELQGRGPVAHHERRGGLPGSDELFVSSFLHCLEQRLARSQHGLGEPPVGAADRGLDRLDRVRRQRSVFLGDRRNERAGRNHLPPLPGGQMGHRVDERFDLRRVGTEATRCVVVGTQNSAEETVGGGRHLATTLVPVHRTNAGFRRSRPSSGWSARAGRPAPQPR